MKLIQVSDGVHDILKNLSERYNISMRELADLFIKKSIKASLGISDEEKESDRLEAEKLLKGR